jgi:hypothetical protein
VDLLPLDQDVDTIPQGTVLVLSWQFMAGWYVVGVVAGADTVEAALRLAVEVNPSLDGQPVLGTKIGGNASERYRARRTPAEVPSLPPPVVELEELKAEEV